MSKIRVLPDHISNLIAAGEVVERPASVAKELVENAIDAGATRIVIDVESGGRRLLRITDDGEGMTRDDAILAFERHATSKISKAEDLAAIGTLGFRGEALASIASVARVELLTCTEDASAGTRVVIELATVQSGSTPDSAVLGFRVKTFVVGDHDYPAVGDIAAAGDLEKQKIAAADPNANKKKVIGGAIAGAILGQMMGKNTKSTVIGAAAGAAAGGIVAKAGERYEACLPDGAPLRLTLAEPVVMGTK